MKETTLLKKFLLEELGARLATREFVPRPRGQSFIRSTPFGNESVHLSFFADGGRTFSTTEDIGIRFDDVEHIVMARETLISASEKKTTATLGCELGNLMKGKQRVWQDIGSRGEVVEVADEMFAAFIKIAIPYFERYSIREQALAVLARDDNEAALHSPSLPTRAKRAIALTLIMNGDVAAKEMAALKLQRVRQLDSRQLPLLKQFVDWLDENNWSVPTTEPPAPS